MKFFLLCLVSISFLAVWSQTTSHNIQVDGLTREYRRYVPASYDGNNAVPLVFNLHGYSSNNVQQEFYGDFRPIADTAGFILIHPNGTFDANNNRFWNAFGGVAGVDDVAFISALIDTLSSTYNIDLNRVYSCGMSNGGFMSYKLACDLSERITAVASVTGSMAVGSFASCNPSNPTPIMQIHGTADPTVPYNGNAQIAGVESVVDFWVDFNNCDETPEFIEVPDIVTTDGCTAEHYIYHNGINNSTVEFFKIIDGAHTWPGAPISFDITNQDISASVEIWRFFSQYSLQGLASTEPFELSLVQCFPNPANGQFNIQSAEILDRIVVMDLNGRVVREIQPISNEVLVSDLLPGVYLIQVMVGEQVSFFKQVLN